MDAALFFGRGEGPSDLDRLFVAVAQRLRGAPGAVRATFPERGLHKRSKESETHPDSLGDSDDDEGCGCGLKTETRSEPEREA